MFRDHNAVALKLIIFVSMTKLCSSLLGYDCGEIIKRLQEKSSARMMVIQEDSSQEQEKPLGTTEEMIKEIQAKTGA